MLGVLVVHLSQQFPIPQWMKIVSKPGAYGVQIFFVISAYLGCSYFFRPTATTLGYYKKRALRIVPIYYAAILVAMVYIELFTSGYNEDIFHLGWLRYFFALNTILPSADFTQWNNSFGFWTMTEFIFFYITIPMVIGIISTYRRSLIWFSFCCAVALLMNYTVPLLPENMFSSLGQFILWSPLMQMQHFALGMVIFFAARENKIRESAILCTILAVVMILIFLLSSMKPDFDASYLKKLSAALIISSSTGLAILLFQKKRSVSSCGKWLMFLSKYSFHVYLSHLLALAIGEQVSHLLDVQSIICICSVKFFVFIVGTLLLCSFLELTQRTANKIFS